MSDYIPMPTNILKLKDLSSNSKLVYARIKAFQPDICRMIVADFMKELGLSRVSINNALNELFTKEYIKEMPYHGLKIIKEGETETPAEENITKTTKH